MLAIVAGCVERVLLADHKHGAVGRIDGVVAIFEAFKECLLGLLPTVVPFYFDSRALTEHWKFIVNDRPLRIGLLVVATGDGLHAGRIAQIEGHEWHIERMTSHVAQSAGAKVPKTTPSKGLIAVAIRPLRRWSQPQIPVQMRRRLCVGRTTTSLRPNGPVCPDVDFLYRSQAT